MITVKDFLEKITNPDRIKIVKGEEVLYAGYKGALVHEGAAALWPRSNRNRRRTISFQIWK